MSIQRDRPEYTQEKQVSMYQEATTIDDLSIGQHITVRNAQHQTVYTGTITSIEPRTSTHLGRIGFLDGSSLSVPYLGLRVLSNGYRSPLRVMVTVP